MNETYRFSHFWQLRLYIMISTILKIKIVVSTAILWRPLREWLIPIASTRAVEGVNAILCIHDAYHWLLPVRRCNTPLRLNSSLFLPSFIIIRENIILFVFPTVQCRLACEVCRIGVSVAALVTAPPISDNILHRILAIEVIWYFGLDAGLRRWLLLGLLLLPPSLHQHLIYCQSFRQGDNVSLIHIILCY